MIVKFSLIIGLLLIGVKLSVDGWMRPSRSVNMIVSSSNRIRDDRCQQFQFFTQSVDHFGFENMDTFEQRYIINRDYWQSEQPIFFYTGNEGLNGDLLIEICSSMFRRY